MHETTLGAYLQRLRKLKLEGPEGERRPWSQSRLAKESGLSLAYIKKVEQSKVHSSDRALNKIADALELDSAQRHYIHNLTHHAVSRRPGPSQEPALVGIGFGERQYLDSLDPAAAAILDPHWNVLYSNSAYSRIFPGLVDDGNVLTWFFLRQESKVVMVEWETEAHLTVRWWKHLMTANQLGSNADDLYEKCMLSPDFERMWNEPDVAVARPSAQKILRSIDDGTLSVYNTRLWAPTDPNVAHTFYLATRMGSEDRAIWY